MKNKSKKQEKKQVDALKSLQSSVKQLPAIKDFISKEGLNPEIIYEIEKKLKKKKKKAQADRSKMVYKGYNKTYDFRKFKTIHVFGNDIKNNFINMSMANDKQSHLAKHIKKFKSKTRP